MLFHRYDGLEAITPLVDADDLEVLGRLQGKPALLHLDGTTDAPHRLVSVLLHGNEDSGFRAVLDWLREAPTPRMPMWIFIGNTRAAIQNGPFADRYLPDQEDFNRVWGIHPVSTRMRRCAADVLRIITDGPVDAAIDIHNNTGDNPLYAILPQAEDATYALGGAVADTGLLWGTQEHTLMQALEPHCPAVAVECGMAGVPEHAKVAREVLDRFLEMAPPHQGPGSRPERVFEVHHRVEVRAEVSFTFAEHLDTDEYDFAVTPGLDIANFGMLFAHTALGTTIPGSDLPLIVRGPHGEDDTERFLLVDADGVVRLREDVIPAMMTRTPLQTRRDCLFYIVRRRA